VKKAFFLLAGALFFIVSSSAYSQDENLTQDTSGASTLQGLSTEYEPAVNFSPGETPAPETEPPGYLDTNFEPEKVDSSFSGAPGSRPEENPYRTYNPLTDTQASPSNPGAGYSRESDLIGEKSTEYEPEPPYNNE